MTNDAPMSGEKLGEILKEHAKWVKSEGNLGTQADLLDANLQEANLFDANLQEAKLINANLQGANLRYANLQGAYLGSANLQRATLVRANLQEANLRYANLQEATLEEANLQGADLRDAQWTDLSWATLVKRTWPTWTNLDNTRIKGSRFGCVGWRSPSWLQLKRHYTGVKTLFHLLLLLAFVTPLLLRGMFWVGVNRAQEALASTATDVRHAADALLAEGHTAAPIVDRVAATLETQNPCLADECRTLPVLLVLLGFGQGASAVVPAILLLLYNLIRAGLTWVVGPMRDDEEATGVSPAYEEYKRLVPLHWAFRVLFWVAIATVVNAARVYLLLPVSIPAP